MWALTTAQVGTIVIVAALAGAAAYAALRWLCDWSDKRIDQMVDEGLAATDDAVICPGMIRVLVPGTLFGSPSMRWHTYDFHDTDASMTRAEALQRWGHVLDDINVRTEYARVDMYAPGGVLPGSPSTTPPTEGDQPR